MIAPEPVVLDTNVFVAAAFNPRSHAGRVVAALREERLRLVWNEATRCETRRILERIPPIAWEPFAALFREVNRYRGTVNPAWFGQIRDPDDRVFGALAYAAGATLITQDDDLLEIRSNVDVPILTASEFIRRAWPSETPPRDASDGGPASGHVPSAPGGST